MAPSSFINQEKWHLHILRKYHISRKKVNKNGQWVVYQFEKVTCYQKTGAEEMLESPEREEIRGEEKAFFGRADHRDFAASRTG
jgi:hypothetical protein